jgi:hypothetical protein
MFLHFCFEGDRPGVASLAGGAGILGCTSVRSFEWPASAPALWNNPSLFLFTLAVDFLTFMPFLSLQIFQSQG